MREGGISGKKFEPFLLHRVALLAKNSANFKLKIDFVVACREVTGLLDSMVIPDVMGRTTRAANRFF